MAEEGEAGALGFWNRDPKSAPYGRAVARGWDNSELIDPFSILGALSFGTFILTVLYNKYKHRNPTRHSPLTSPINTQLPNTPNTPPAAGGGTTKLAPLTEDTIEKILTVAQKLITESTAEMNQKHRYARTRNSTLPPDYDYEDGGGYEKRNLNSGTPGQTKLRKWANNWNDDYNKYLFANE